MPGRDLNDRAREGSLPSDPDAESVPMKAPVAMVRSTTYVSATNADDAERKICASLLWASTYAPQAANAGVVMDIVSPEKFGDVRCGSILDAIAGLQVDGQVADAVAVRSAMVRRGLYRVEVEQLESLMSRAVAPTDVMLRQWAELVRDAWRRRQVVASSALIANSAHSGSLGECVAAADAVAALVSSQSDTQTVKALPALDTAIREIFDPKADRGVSSGIVAYDRIVGPLRAGHYTVLGAFTGDGKTAWGLTIAGNVAIRGEGVLYASTEMSPDQLMLRLACAWSSVSAGRMMKGRPTPEEQSAVIRTMVKFKTLPLEVFRETGMTNAQFDVCVRRVKADMAARGIRLRLVVADYIQEMQLAGAAKNLTEEQRLRAISSSLNDTAKRHGVHVLALAQTHAINVKADGGDGKPDIRHLAGAKSIARPAENVAFVHRTKIDGKYPPRGPADIVVRKSRWGQRGDVPVVFDGPLMRFADDPDRPLMGDE